MHTGTITSFSILHQSGFERTELFEGNDHVGNLLCLWVTCSSTKNRAVVACPSLEDSTSQMEKAPAELIQRL